MKKFYKPLAISGFIALMMMCFTNYSNAQNTPTTPPQTNNLYNWHGNGPAPTVFIELLGPGLGVTANIDSRFTNRRDGIGARVGVGYLANDGWNFFTLPMQLNYLAGRDGKYFELGAGATYMSTRDNDPEPDKFINFKSGEFVGTLTFGFRYQPERGGFNFRAGLTPLFDSRTFIPWGGVSFGYSFQ